MNLLHNARTSIVLFAVLTALFTIPATWAAVTFDPTPAHAQGKPKIAYVDLQKALNSVNEGKQAKKKLKTMFDKRQKKLDAEQEKLKKEKDKLQKEFESGLLNDKAKREKMMAYQKRFYELQTLYAKLQKELSEAEAKETRKIFGKMREILKDIGLKEGYTVILEKTESSVLYAPDKMDITDQLVKRYNSK